jgi:8-oxo-dGTP diphosphatase
MSIFSHNVYENVRTRVIVIHLARLLLLEPYKPGAGWQLPGGGLEPNESLAECGEREVFEETGIQVKVSSVAFLREWVVPKYCSSYEDGEGVGFGLEVFLYAHLTTQPSALRLERPDAQTPHWVPLAQLPMLPVWPKELKTLAGIAISGHTPQGVPSFVSQLESPDVPAPEATIFA